MFSPFHDCLFYSGHLDSVHIGNQIALLGDWDEFETR